MRSLNTKILDNVLVTGTGFKTTFPGASKWIGQLNLPKISQQSAEVTHDEHW